MESQQTGVIRTLVRLGCDSPELSMLETGADAHALLTQRKCENAGVGGALSFERSGNEHRLCQPASRALNFTDSGSSALKYKALVYIFSTCLPKGGEVPGPP